MKRAIFVLGAQRSGTSVTSHVLSELSVQFGDRDRFIQFDHNPIFFELQWVNELNDQIVKAIGHQYSDFFLPLEADFMAPKIQPQIQAIQANIHRLIQNEWHDQVVRSSFPFKAIEAADSQDFIIGIKDPRISLTFPIWEPVLLARGYSIQVVQPFRSPVGFLHSNQKLFHQWEGWTIERHLHFWLQFNLAAVYFTRRYPLHLLNYDRLMQFSLEEIVQLVTALSLNASLTEKAVAVVQTEHYHHGDRSKDVQTDIPWVNEVYLKLCNKTITANDYLNYRQQMRSMSLV